MAGRFGLSSTAPATMIVTNTPAADLALTNLAYCSASDLQNYAVPGTKLFLALVADSFVLSLAYPFHFFTFASIIFNLRILILIFSLYSSFS
ncbi:Vesicle-fusing ATPase, partial [Cucurbita argyrosperma subsp. argyrosperma]